MAIEVGFCFSASRGLDDLGFVGGRLYSSAYLTVVFRSNSMHHQIMHTAPYSICSHCELQPADLLLLGLLCASMVASQVSSYCSLKHNWKSCSPAAAHEMI